MQEQDNIMAVISTDRIKDVRKNMVGREGFEPSTNGLKVHCSTN